MLVRDDFRFRSVGGGRYRVAQRVGSGWELLSEVYPSKRDAAEFVARVVAASAS